MRGAVLAILAAVAPALFGGVAHGHGVLLQPASRNWKAYLEQSEYNSHALNAGGNWLVSDNDKIKWPAGRMGMCGDAFNATRWDRPGPVVATYAEGQVITVDFVIAVNHLGRIDMSVCDLAAKGDEAAARCKQLKRVGSSQEFFYLPFLSNWTGGNSGYVQPAYGDGGFSWYLMPQVMYDEGCRKQRLCNQFWKMVVYRTAWQLPAGYTCAHCKLQWHYLTAHNCWPPCPDKTYSDVYCKNVQIFPECGAPGTTYPERFANCADISIASAASRVAATSQLPAWNGQLALQSGKFGQPRAFKMLQGGGWRRRRRLLLRQAHLA